MSDEWEKEIEKATFEAGTFTDGFLDMASYSPRNAKITQAVRTEDALRIAREAFEAGKREGRAEVLQPIIKKMGDLTAKFYAQGAETAARGTAALVRKLESLAKELGE